MAQEATRGWFGLIVAAAAFTALPAQSQAQETDAAMEDAAATQDTAATGQAPMDTAATGQTQRDTTTTGQTQRDTAGQDTTQWGYPTDTNPDVQNPPGYRGMERPTNVFPPDSARDTTGQRVEGAATGTYGDSAWNDTTGAQQNPPGYRGMERPAGLDTADTGGAADTGRVDTVEVGRAEAGDTAGTQEEIDRYTQRLGELGYKVEKMSKEEKKAWKAKKRSDGTSSSSGADTTRVGETTPKVPEDSVRRLPSARGDTTGQSGSTGADTTGR